jgi:hypothetical protein
MKRLKLISAIVFSLFLALAACKKDNGPTISKEEVSGIYIGKYGNDDNSPSTFFSFNIKPDGTMQELNNSGLAIGNGTYTLSGNTFLASYHWTFPVNTFFTAKATYDPATKQLTGTWGWASSESDGGKWYMKKQ